MLFPTDNSEFKTWLETHDPGGTGSVDDRVHLILYELTRHTGTSFNTDTATLWHVFFDNEGVADGTLQDRWFYYSGTYSWNPTLTEAIELLLGIDDGPNYLLIDDENFLLID